MRWIKNIPSPTVALLGMLELALLGWVLVGCAPQTNTSPPITTGTTITVAQLSASVATFCNLKPTADVLINAALAAFAPGGLPIAATIEALTTEVCAKLTAPITGG